MFAKREAKRLPYKRDFIQHRNVVRIYQKPSSERKGDHEVVEGACVTIKIVLSSPLRTLPQSLRDSSLPEGAFEKFAAVLFGSRRPFYFPTFPVLFSNFS